jgi:hypothetical protein
MEEILYYNAKYRGINDDDKKQLWMKWRLKAG